MKLSTQSFNTHGKLSIVQFSTSNVNHFQFISGDEAISKKLIEVKELDFREAVNSIHVINMSDQFVFFSDGDVLIGAKQNRVLNTSVLLAPNSKTELPVSCIEAGRWNFNSKKFSSSGVNIPVNLRSEKSRDVHMSLKMNKKHRANQSRVWENVHETLSSHKVMSMTSDLGSVYENKKDILGDIHKSIRPDKKSNGAAIFIDNELKTVDIFGRTDIYKQYLPKLLSGAAVSIQIRDDDKFSFNESEANYKTLDFMDKIEMIESSIHKGVAMGNEYRYESEKMHGFKLVYEDHLIHFCGFNTQ